MPDLTTTHCPELAQLLPAIIADNALHARWLNSLSMMESVGARKIAAYIDPIHVDETTLQHAAEEARHALYLKRQIGKLGQQFDDYTADALLAPHASYRYLHRLDWACSRYFQRAGFAARALKQRCYLMTTLLIEVRAMALYQTYQDALTQAGSRVHVRSILKEEEGHLAQMMRQWDELDAHWRDHYHALHAIEQTLFARWLTQLPLTTS